MIILGSRGAWASINGEGQCVSGFRVKAADAIAAGDTFNDVSVTVLLEETPPSEAVRFAYAAATIVATRKGV